MDDISAGEVEGKPVGESDDVFVGSPEGENESNLDGTLLCVSVGALDEVMLGDSENIVGKLDIKFVGPSEGVPDTVLDGDVETNADGI